MVAAVLCAGALTGTGISPPSAFAAGPEAAVRSTACSTETGPHQAEAERHLGLTPDGVQTPADCAAIHGLQTRNGFETANGYAGIETWRMIQYEKAAASRARLTGCPYGSDLVVCIDLTRQLLWVWDGNQVAFGPVPIRTGTVAEPTRTGRHEIFDRVEKQWSDLFDGPMPFSQFFEGGQALHGSYRDIWEEPGSHGCVNLRYDDAKRLWSALRLGDSVYVWGTRTV
ncbi:L,D-transpeptidase [Streptomyces sp. NPDC004838]